MLFFFVNIIASLIWIEPTSDLDYNFNQNQGFQDEIGKTYNRFPARAESIVRDRVWQLSRYSSSISIKFISNSSSITVQYQSESPFSCSMMNKIGTSGIDLYGYDENGSVHFFAGSYNFGSTITFQFSEHNKSVIFTYLLILPSYDVIKPSSFKIGYDESSYFQIFPSEIELPVTFYGTSITQGACPSRPGLSYVNWLSRELQLPVRNFGFMGQGVLEREVIELITEERSRLFVLDCLANLVFESVEKVVNLTVDAYKQIRKKWPKTPIVLVEFSGYTNYEFNDQYRTYTDNMNTASSIALRRLEDELNATNLYYISKKQLGITSDDISDPVHPMDNGMKKQKDALLSLIKECLNMKEPINSYSTQQPKYEHRNLEFQERHQKNIQKVINSNLTKAIIGDSITQIWPSVGEKSWNKYMNDKFINLGIGYDRIENVLYRVYHDEIEIEYINLDKIILLIGTNNIGLNNNTEIVNGIKFLVNQIHIRQPGADLFVLGILPRDGYEKLVESLNSEIKNEAEKDKFWNFADPGKVLIDEETGLIKKNCFSDGLHPNSDGYDLIAPLIANL